MELHQVQEYARQVFDTLGLNDWAIGFDHARKRAGMCNYTQRKVSFSRHLMLLYDQAQVQETVLHEAAHALVGPKHGHDGVWQALAISLGASGRRTLDDTNPKVEAPWVGTCPNGHSIQRFRRPKRVIACGRCGRGFSLDCVFSWQFQGTDTIPEGSYLRELRKLQRG